MKHLMSVLAAALFLSACQQESAKNETEVSKAAENKVELAESVKTEADSVEADVAHSPNAEHSHDHDANAQHAVEAVAKGESKEKFKTVEEPMTCEQPVVVEFFAYQCPHCYDLEPAAEEWRKKNAGKVKFVSVPTHLGANEFGSLLLIHHAAKALDILEKVQPALFARVHKEKKLFNSPEKAADFLAAHGADKDKALEILADQKAMGDLIEADFGMMAHYKITHVPQVMVNHQYITDVSSAGGKTEVFELVDELLKRKHQCKSKS